MSENASFSVLIIFYSQSQNALTKILKVGELIPAKISSITKTEKGHEVKATINPRLINGDKKHNSFKRGETIWANVVSKLDHGYELTVGVNNCRVFLPFKNVNSEEDLGEFLTLLPLIVLISCVY